MNATPHPQDTVPASAPASLNALPGSTPPAPGGTADATGAALDDGPLARPLWRLWEGLDRLARAGHLRGVELDLEHADCPCFLLDVAPERPKFYVEMFLDSLDDPEGRGETLFVMMNWMGSDTEPAVWETGLDATGLGETGSGAPENVPDFGEVLDHILWATGNLTQS